LLYFALKYAFVKNSALCPSCRQRLQIHQFSQGDIKAFRELFLRDNRNGIGVCSFEVLQIPGVYASFSRKFLLRQIVLSPQSAQLLTEF